MAEYKAHCEDCKKKLGKPYGKVHNWLDEFAPACITGGFAHRRERHHKEGVEEIRKMYGDEAAEAAEIHILRDLFFWGEIPSKDEYDDIEVAYMSAMGSMFH